LAALHVRRLLAEQLRDSLEDLSLGRRLHRASVYLAQAHTTGEARLYSPTRAALHALLVPTPLRSALRPGGVDWRRQWGGCQGPGCAARRRRPVPWAVLADSDPEDGV